MPRLRERPVHRPAGRLRALEGRLDGLWTPRSRWRANKVMRAWATALGHLMIEGDAAYRIRFMYLEYENVADPDDPVSIPAYSRDDSDGLAYFLGLSAGRDYLRIPIAAGQLSSTDEALYPGGNLQTYFAQTEGFAAGQLATPFGAATNSKICGGALVAAPVPDDPSQDLVVCRTYLDLSEQLAKAASRQIAFQWDFSAQ